MSETLPVITVSLKREHDVVLARQRARSIATVLGFAEQEQVRFATAVSELARNAYQYARGGEVRFEVQREDDHSLLVAHVRDEGPGIERLDHILRGDYVSRTGMGLGILGARRLSDRFTIDSTGTGTTVQAGKVIAHHPPLTGRDVSEIAARLAKDEPYTPFAELQHQNHELIAAMDSLRERQGEVERLARELEETNRGVVALYAELDDRAAELRALSETKTRFLSDVSHELRTPLSSIVNLARVMLSHADGPLTAEQERQVRMIERSAESLTEMVSGLLDVAKIEAGKVELRPERFAVESLFVGLRGMFRPLVASDAVTLVLEPPSPPIELHTDEQRLSQILRNFISNALKFTPAGEVRVTATSGEDDMVRFTVADTGIGIAPEDQERIFADYAQVNGPIQRRVRGTGLGLPLTRRLAALLGGRVTLESAPGEGSRFSVIIPREVATEAVDV